MFVALMILTLSLVVLLPRVRDIHKNNNAIIALFVLIPAAELQLCVNLVEEFIDLFIDKP